MENPPPAQLLARVRSLPAAGLLFEHLGSTPGLYLVGGAVRDLLLGGRPLDLDLVVEGDAVATASRLGEPRVHDRFGTCTVIAGGFVYDIATARSESYSRPGALPDVAPATVREDLRRRDFTVNAIAIALDGERPGELIAVPLAEDDLALGRLRVLHPGSFRDDPTRLLRLARYAARLAFAPEDGTRGLAQAAIAGGALQTVSGPRVGSELRLAVREPDPVATLGAMAELKLDRAIHPGFGLDDPKLARSAFSLLPPDGRGDLLALGVAANGIAAGELGELLDRLAFEAHDRDRIIAVADLAPALSQALLRARRPSEIAAAVGAAGPEPVAFAGALGPAAEAREWLSRLRQVQLEIGGRDLIEAGVQAGPDVGRGLRGALAAKLDGEVSTREQELVCALLAARATG